MARKKGSLEEIDVYELMDKQYKGIRVKEDDEDIEFIPTGSITLDRALGSRNEDGTWVNGGIPRRRVSVIEGWESDGKTTLALSIARQEQLLGGKPALFDFEQTYLKSYAEKCGVDTHPDRWQVFQPQSLEQGQELMELMVKSGNCSLIIVDSIPAMTPDKKINGDEDGKDDASGSVLANRGKDIGLQARLLGDWLDVFTKWANKHDVTIVAINQFRANISGYGAATKSAGGNALRFYTSVRIQLRKIETETRTEMNDLSGEKEEIPVANKVRFKIDKNKVGIPYREGKLVIRLGYGVDDIRTVMDIAKNKGVLDVNKAWWSYKEPGDPLHFKAAGAENVREHLVSNPDVFNAIVDELGLSA